MSGEFDFKVCGECVGCEREKDRHRTIEMFDRQWYTPKVEALRHPAVDPSSARLQLRRLHMAREDFIGSLMKAFPYIGCCKPVIVVKL